MIWWYVEFNPLALQTLGFGPTDEDTSTKWEIND